MSAFGLLILVQPAVLCLVSGISLATAGILYLAWIRRYPRRIHQVIAMIAIFLITMVAYSLMISIKYDLPPISIEMISGL